MPQKLPKVSTQAPVWLASYPGFVGPNEPASSPVNVLHFESLLLRYLRDVAPTGSAKEKEASLKPFRWLASLPDPSQLLQGLSVPAASLRTSNYGNLFRAIGLVNRDPTSRSGQRQGATSVPSQGRDQRKWWQPAEMGGK